MRLYDTTLPHRSLIHEIWDLCDADIISLPLRRVLRSINSSIEILVGKIINADGNWQFDDTNYTDLPSGTGNLVSGQSSYSFSSEYLDILEVMILTTGGVYQRITPFDPSELGMSFDDWVGSATGTPPNGIPQYYDKLGDSIRLDRSPTATHVTLTAGLKVRFKRTAKVYTMSNSTTITSGEESVEPGIASPYHQLIAYMAAVPFCANYKKDRVEGYKREIGSDDRRSPYYGGMTLDMVNFYARREKDVRPVLTMEPVIYE